MDSKKHKSNNHGAWSQHDLLPYLPSQIEGKVQWRDTNERLAMWKQRIVMCKRSFLVIAKEGENDDPEKSITVIPLRGCTVRQIECKKPGLSAVEIESYGCLRLPTESLRVWIDALTRPQPEVCLQDFTIVRKIGDGGYGEVFLARKNSNNEMLALKAMLKNHPGGVKGKAQPIKMHHLVHERASLQKLQHPHITALRYAFQDNYFWYLCMDFVVGGELYEAVKICKAAIPVPVIRIWAAQLVCAIKHIHKRGYLHRDLKLENLLLDENNHIRIADFGLAVHVRSPELRDRQRSSNSRSIRVVGSLATLAPETVKTGVYGFEVDWWALGVMLYELIYNRNPFQEGARSTAGVCKNILHRHPRFPSKGANHDLRLTDLVSKLLIKNPALRIPESKLQEHPFFQGVDWEAVNAGNSPPVTLPIPPKEKGPEKPSLELSYMTGLSGELLKFSFFSHTTISTPDTAPAKPGAPSAPAQPTVKERPLFLSAFAFDANDNEYYDMMDRDEGGLEERGEIPPLARRTYSLEATLTEEIDGERLDIVNDSPAGSEHDYNPFNERRPKISGRGGSDSTGGKIPIAQSTSAAAAAARSLGDGVKSPSASHDSNVGLSSSITVGGEYHGEDTYRAASRSQDSQDVHDEGDDDEEDDNGLLGVPKRPHKDDGLSSFTVLRDSDELKVLEVQCLEDDGVYDDELCDNGDPLSPRSNDDELARHLSGEPSHAVGAYDRGAVDAESVESNDGHYLHNVENDL